MFREIHIRTTTGHITIRNDWNRQRHYSVGAAAAAEITQGKLPTNSDQRLLRWHHVFGGGRHASYALGMGDEMLGSRVERRREAA